MALIRSGGGGNRLLVRRRRLENADEDEEDGGGSFLSDVSRFDSQRRGNICTGAVWKASTTTAAGYTTASSSATSSAAVRVAAPAFILVTYVLGAIGEGAAGMKKICGRSGGV
jgi:hypothetical protein